MNLIDELIPRRPPPAVGYKVPGEYRREMDVQPSRGHMIATDHEWPTREVHYSNEEKPLVLAQLDAQTTIGRMRMALTEGGRPEMAYRLKAIEDCWWVPPGGTPDTRSLLLEYRRDFDFICRAQWIAVQGQADYNVIDPETGVYSVVSAASFQGEAGYGVLEAQMLRALQS